MLAKMSTVMLASFECESSNSLTRRAAVLSDIIMWLFLNVVLDLYRKVFFCLEGCRTVANPLMPDIQGLLWFHVPHKLYPSLIFVVPFHICGNFLMDENPVIIGLYSFSGQGD